MGREIRYLKNDLANEYEKYCKALSEVDLQLQDVLRELEVVKLNVVEGYYSAKKIQGLRIKR